MNRKYAIIAVLLGVMGFSFKGIFIKLVYESGVDSITIMGYRGIFSLPFFLAACFLFKEKQKLPISSYVKMGITGFLFYFSSITDTIGLGLIPVNVERVIMFTTPIFVLLLSFICFNKRYQIGIYIAAVISWIGVAISFASKGLENGDSIFGIACVLTSSASYAGCMIMTSREVKYQNPLAFNAKLMTLCCVISLVPVLFNAHFDVTAIVPAKGEWTYPVLLAVVSTVLPSFLMSYGIKGCGEVVTSTFNNIGPFITMTAGVLILSETIGVYDIVGAIIVATSIMYINRQMAPKITVIERVAK